MTDATTPEQPRTALEALAAVKGTVLFIRNRLGKPPEQIRVTDLLAIVDELMDEQREAEKVQP